MFQQYFVLGNVSCPVFPDSPSSQSFLQILAYDVDGFP